MNWGDLRFFLAVCQAGSLVGAARLLKSSQPTVGRHLQLLEQAVGCKLFQRGSAGYILTDEGAQVLRYAQRIENDVDTLLISLAGQEQELVGHLRVASSDWFGNYVLAPCIALFTEQHPRVKVELVTDSRAVNLNRREADLAFRIMPFSDIDIAQRKLTSMQYALYTANDNTIDIERDKHLVRLVTMSEQYLDLPDVIWLRQAFPNAKVVFSSNSRQAQAEYCARSKTFAVLPVALAEQIPDLKQVMVQDPVPDRHIWLGYHQDLRGLSRLRSFIDFVSQYLQQQNGFTAVEN